MDVLGLFDLPLWALLITLLVIFLYHHAYSGFDHFEKRGIPTVQPVNPFVGNLWNCWKRDNQKWQFDAVRKYGRVFGAFDGKKPMLYVSDPEVIKGVLVKEFDCFTDHKRFSDGLIGQKYLRKFLFVSLGQEWKEARAAVSPAFSSGKIKKMSHFMEDCCTKMIQEAREIANGPGDIDIKGLLGKMNLDFIAQCAFGTKLDNLSDPKNPFVVNSINAFRPTLFDSPWALIPELYPWTQIFGLEALVNQKALNFFIDMVKELIRQRKTDTEKRGDFLDCLLEEQEAEQQRIKEDPSVKLVMTDEVLIAQCVTFLAAGYDTVVAAMASTAHYLGLNPECQEKLHDEVAAEVKEHQGVLNHEAVQHCYYLEQVIQEAQRINPNDYIIERRCTKSCEIGGIKFKEGDTVIIPLWSLQHMEENFPDPEKFDPDRFAPENKGNIKPYTYFPFGLGPRMCIGMRFAMEECKLAIGNLILNFRLSPGPKMNDPIKKHGNRFGSTSQEVWLKLDERRED